MRVGLLTGGGDCPGLNAVIRAVVRKGIEDNGWETVGFRNGWQGPVEGLIKPIGLDDATKGILLASEGDELRGARESLDQLGRERTARSRLVAPDVSPEPAC